MFLYWSHKIPHSDVTVTISFFSGLVAINISLFNIFVSQPNEFDPRLLEIELKRKKLQREKYLSLEMKDGIKVSKD